jgi:hypothetical protein
MGGSFWRLRGADYSQALFSDLLKQAKIGAASTLALS